VIKKKLKQILANHKITRMISNLLPPTVVVLTYHDICENNDISSWLRVKKSSFELQLSQLREIGNFIRPSDLYHKETLSRHGLNFLITFDDGFIKQYKLALPILEKFQIPALFFISTENVQTGDLFWFDRIITPIQVKRITSLELRLVGLRDYQFSMSEGDERWNDIQVLLEDIKAKGNCTHPDVQKVLRFFDDTFGDIIKKITHQYRPLKEDDICKMQASDLCYLGSHSHRHEILPYLDDKDIKNNLVRSKEFLENLLRQPITHFSYPNGNTNNRVTALCRESGYEYCYTATSGLVKSNTNLMEIPRISVGGYDSIQILFWKINRALMKGVIK
jgi:peptidoglycan/xylan/chitin deacetylase (PgdA/CDA1 family)